MQIYVVWQPSNTAQVDEEVCFTYAKAIFSTFNRTIDDALDRDIGIPTYFISVAGCLDAIIDWEAAEKTVVVWFINSPMVLERKKWENDVRAVLEHKQKYNERVCWVGVSLNKGSNNFYERINHINRIELQEEPEDKRKGILLRRLTFRLAQELYDKKEGESLPLTLFLSYARKDGKHIVEEFDKAIHQIKENVNTFVDVKSIEVGKYFRKKIINNIGESVFVAINTNAYSEREWCLTELLLAKKYNRPIVVVNAQKNIIKRTSPYIGNTSMVHSTLLLGEKGIHTTDELQQEYKRITYCVLIETLRYVYHERLLNIRVKEQDGSVWKFPAAPELLTIHQRKKIEKKKEEERTARQLLVYPDPPLANREREVLENNLNVTPITATLYPLLSLDIDVQQYTSILSGYIIGLSVSEISSVKDGLHKGVGIWHLQDAMVELTRYLVVCGATCAYGGNLQYPLTKEKNLNFVTQLIELLMAYNSDYGGEQKVINHVAALFATPSKTNPKANEVLQELKAHVLEVVNFIEHKHSFFPQKKEDYTLAQKAACFTYMRQQMFKTHNEAQIFIGGKTEKSQSIILGVIEEAYYALKYNKPIYIIGAFGGASGCLAELFLTGESEPLRTCFEATQAQEDWKDTYKEYVQYLQEYPDWNESPEEIHRRVNYTSLKLFFLRHRHKQQDKYLDNGLNRTENETLFQSKNMLEISSLIIKGLYQYFYQQ